MPRAPTYLETLAFRSLDDAKAQTAGRISLSREDIFVPHGAMWRAEDQPILAATEEIIGCLPHYHQDALDDHNVRNMNERYFKQYLRMTNVRIANLADAFRGRLPVGSTILEIGSFFGSFSLALQCLGYQVTAVDRYDEYKGRFDKHIELMERSGVRVIRTSKETEGGLIRRAGSFDAVIAMAVIEHVPHTPKGFLELLKGATKCGGWLAIDTPNLARFWNRKAMSEGKTIFQTLQDQFECTPPWEGHHREYTGDELVWMLERIGCTDVQLKRFDYNMLQFEVLNAHHIECLEQCINDPAIGDMLLAVGKTAIQQS